MPASFISFEQYNDDSFNSGEGSKPELYLQIGSNNLSFAFCDLVSNHFFQSGLFQLNSREKPGSITHLNDYCNAVEELFATRKWNGGSFHSARVLIENEHYSLVPAKLFREQDVKNYLRINQDIFPDDEYLISHDRIDTLDICNVFAIPLQLKEMIEKILPNAVLKHSLGILLEGIYDLLNQEDFRPALFVNIRTGQTDILFFEASGLRFCQSFPYQAKEDLLYHIMHVANHLSLDIIDLPVYLTGYIDQDDDTFNLMQDFLGRVSLPINTRADQTSHVQQGLTFHKYFTLHSLKKCVS